MGPHGTQPAAWRHPEGRYTKIAVVQSFSPAHEESFSQPEPGHFSSQEMKKTLRKAIFLADKSRNYFLFTYAEKKTFPKSGPQKGLQAAPIGGLPPAPASQWY
jgi:hypothetical protein